MQGLQAVLESENTHLANAFEALLQIAPKSDAVRNLCLAILDYYFTLAATSSSVLEINTISLTISTLVMRFSLLRRKAENRNPAIDAIFSKLNQVTNAIANKRMQLQPVPIEKTICCYTASLICAECNLGRRDTGNIA